MITTENVIRSSNLLLNVRLWFFCIAFVHLAIAAVVILPIDLSVNADPDIKVYERLKWRFITTWFNFINLAYFPLCIYCDWREKQTDGDLWHIMTLRQIRDIVLTSVLFPTILYADILFWFLYFYDVTLITPERLFDYLPPWGQHSLHTVSLLVVTLDLVLVPRRRPSSLKQHLIVMTAFFVVYALVIYYSYLNGDYVYRILMTINGVQAVLLIIIFYVMYLFFFALEWRIIDYVCKKHKQKEKRIM